MRKISLFVTMLLMISVSNIACDQKTSGGLQITGTVGGLNNNQVAFEKISIGGQVDLIKDMIATSDNLDLSLDTHPGAGYYRIRIGRNQIVLVMDGSEKEIAVNGDARRFNNLVTEISGSDMTVKFNTILGDINSGKLNMQNANELALSEDPLIGALILANVYQFRPDQIGLYEQVSASMTQKYPDLYLSKDFAGVVQQIKMQAQAGGGSMATAGVQVGAPAPEISMPGPNGEIYNLSDLKGQVVLLDFWASWCGPCIRKLPEMTMLYEKYKDQGFTVFAVSLDGIDSREASRYPDKAAIDAAKENHRKRWTDAISKHNLSWKHHVSELDKWDTKAAKVYGVTSIPRFYIIDREGIITAVNPRNNLEQEIIKALQAG